MDYRDLTQLKHDLNQAIGYLSRVIRQIDADITNQQNQPDDTSEETPVEPVANPPKAEKAPKQLETAQRIVDGVKPTKPSKHDR